MGQHLSALPLFHVALPAALVDPGWAFVAALALREVGYEGAFVDGLGSCEGAAAVPEAVEELALVGAAVGVGDVLVAG